LSAKSFIRKLQKILKVIKQEISGKRMPGSPNQNSQSMYEAALYRLVRGGGVKGKIPFFRGMDIFWNYKIHFLSLLMF